MTTNRRSSTGSSISSISLEDTKTKTTFRSSRKSSTEVIPKLSKDTLAKIGNRQIKVVNQEKKKCSSCLKPLTDDGFFALGKLYHKTCFRCKYCTVKLSQIFFVREDQPCCAKCHKEAQEECWVCKKKISDDHIFCNKKFYHPRCMKCYVCGEQLRDRYITYKDQPVCEKDFKEIGHSCSVCDQVITGEVYVLDEAYFCEKDFEAISSTGVCAVCAKDISPDDSLAVGDVLFHHGCMTCQVCNKNMEGKSITLDNKNRVYCTEDYTRKFCSMCAVCKKSIVPKKGQTKVPRLKAMGKDFHLDCFKCEDCSLVLSPGVKGKECWPIGTHLLCYRCNERRQDESERESE